MILTYQQASATVKEKLVSAQLDLLRESVPLDRARGRVLAGDVRADRDYPPFHRSTRDGFALRADAVVTVPTSLERVGEARAGHPYSGSLDAQTGTCVEIMTGAPLPEGADAVVMQEYTERKGTRVEVLRGVGPWENVVRQGSEAVAGSMILPRGRRLGPGEVGLLTSVGCERVDVFRRPEVAILSTGDEVVPFGKKPEWFQIRNSNALALAAQVEAAGGAPRVLDIAPDRKELLRQLVEAGLESDLLLLSGGISVGKYDLVEQVLNELGAEFHFHGVAIRPGKPLAFGRARQKFFFGLPGNPVSTFVTFEIFARPALAMLSGAEFECPIFLRARLGKSMRHKTGLTTFMPARVQTEGADPVVNLIGWQGSGDLVGVAAANCFLVIHPEQTELAEGSWVDVLPKPL